MLRNYISTNKAFFTITSHINPIKRCNIYNNFVKYFTGKTETGFKHTTPKLKMKSVKPIFPPPGDDLQIPDWTPLKFCEKIGGDSYDQADKFTNVKEIFSLKTEGLKAKGVPVKRRKYFLRIVDLMKRGLLTFEYLERRMVVKPVRKLTISQGGAKAKAAADKKAAAAKDKK